MKNSKISVLIIDDNEPFRQFFAKKVQAHPQLQIVGEAGDGAEAVQQAQQLRPDLILLDIGLPALNGIQAARQIRKVCPRSKILFVSENRASDIVEEALTTGAGGYVVKSEAGSQLLPAIEAVLHGEQFVSTGLKDRNAIDNADRALRGKVVARSGLHDVERHELTVCADDAVLVDGLAHSIELTLESGNAMVVMVTESHRAKLLRKLRTDGVDVESAVERNLLILVNVADLLSTVTDCTATDQNRSALIPDVIVEAVRMANEGHRHVAVG